MAIPEKTTKILNMLNSKFKSDKYLEKLKISVTKHKRKISNDY